MANSHSGAVEQGKAICEAYLYHYIEERLEDSIDPDDIYYNPYPYTIRYFFALTAWAIDSDTGAPINIKKISLTSVWNNESAVSQYDTHRFTLPFLLCDNITEDEFIGNVYFEFDDGSRAEIKNLRLKKPTNGFLVNPPIFPPAWATAIQTATLSNAFFAIRDPDQPNEIVRFDMRPQR